MPISPTPWAMEEPLLRLPDEVLVAGGDAPAESGADAADATARHAMAEPPTAHVDAAVQARSSGTGGAALADGAMTGVEAMSPLVVDAPATHAAGQGAVPAETAFDPPAEDAFPTLAALEAIRAAFAADPPGLDAAARADFAALLGLDPAVAAEDAALLDALRDAPAPDGDALRAEWLSEAAVDVPPPWPVPAQDWPLG